MPDGRNFWMDEAIVREILSRLHHARFEIRHNRNKEESQ